VIQQKLVYRCTLCGKDYENPQQHCICENGLKAGDNIGPFHILEKDGSNYKVECNLCGIVKYIHYSNIRRQVSCGCKPRHINISRVLPTEIRYVCKKCNKQHLETLPLEEWCCDE